MAAVSSGKAWFGYVDSPQLSEDGDSRRYMRNYGPSTSGLRVGWIDHEDVYLDPDTSYKAAREMSADGSSFLISLDTLRRRLKDQGLLASTDVGTSRQSVCIRRTIEGRRRDVLHLHISTLGAETLEMGAAEFGSKF
jgi:hypothetical protein